MRTITYSCAAVLLLCLVLFGTSMAAIMVNNRALVDKINSDPSSTWRAKEHAIFAGKTIAQIAGTYFVPVNAAPANAQVSKLSYNVTLKDLPENYNPDKEYPECSVGITNQGQCGSSWAFPIVASVGNRYCIVNARKQLPPVPVLYSTQYMLSCDKNNYCCNGGSLNTAYDFIAKNGLPLDSCFRYNSSYGVCPDCPTKCNDGSAIRLYKLVKPGTTQVLANVESAMQDIVNYGYVSTGIDVYNDFMMYQSGIYQHTGSSQYMGSHGIRVVGFGVDAASKLPYWVRNVRKTVTFDTCFFVYLFCRSLLTLGVPHGACKATFGFAEAITIATLKRT